MKRIKNIFLDFKWYIISGVLLIVAVYLVFFTDSGDEKIDKLYDWAIDKRGDIVKKKIKNKEKDVDKTKEKIEKIDKELEKVRDKKQGLDKHDKSKTLKELSNSWKNLGY